MNVEAFEEAAVTERRALEPQAFRVAIDLYAGELLPEDRYEVGRERERLEVKRLLAMTRLLTLTGAGGSGKTRLALKVARDLVGAYPEGVWLVDLAPLSEANLVEQAVAQALGVREQPGRPLVQTLKDTLRSRKMLLVDNCEHLVEAVVGLVDSLLDSCPSLRVLATSRETLNTAGEVTWVVPSLTVMYPLRMVRQALRLPLLVTLLVLAMSACGGGSSAQEEEQANEVHHIPEDSQVYEGKPLPAGRYETEEFKPAMSFTLEKGWSRGGAELRDIWNLQDLQNDAFWVVFASSEEVWDPKGSDGLKRAPAPEDMVGWLQANPHMKSEIPKPTSFGGEKGVQFDAIVTGVVESPLCPGCADVPLFPFSDGTAGVEKGEKVRFIVLEDVKEQTVTIFIESSAVGFEEFLAKGQKVVDSVKWGGS